MAIRESEPRVPTPTCTGTSKGQSDETLMRLSREGNTFAFQRLVDRHQGPVRRFCWGMLGDAALADDVAQDVFVDVWRARTRYQDRARFRAYLYTSARNRCRSFLRKRSVRERARRWLQPEADADHQDGEVLFLAGEAAHVLRSRIQGLPEKYRAPVLLRFVEELSYREIGKVLNLKEVTARSRVHAALKKLRIQWEEEEHV